MDFTPVIASSSAMLCWFSLLMLRMPKSLWAKGNIEDSKEYLLAHWAREICGMISINKLEMSIAFIKSKYWKALVVGSILQPEQSLKPYTINKFSAHLYPVIVFCKPTKSNSNIANESIIDLIKSHDASISSATQKQT